MIAIYNAFRYFRNAFQINGQIKKSSSSPMISNMLSSSNFKETLKIIFDVTKFESSIFPKRFLEKFKKLKNKKS